MALESCFPKHSQENFAKNQFFCNQTAGHNHRITSPKNQEVILLNSKTIQIPFYHILASQVQYKTNFNTQSTTYCV